MLKTSHKAQGRIEKKFGRVRLTGLALSELRASCLERDGYSCRECGKKVMWEAGFCSSGHMAHIIGRGRGGSDTLDNVRTLCLLCHEKEHNCGGKPLPRKP